MEQISAVVLCGGKGSRLGGVDKPLRALLGQPLLDRVLAGLRPQAPDLVIVANARHEAYASRGVRVVDDGIYAGRGPLAGIAAGLAAANHEHVVCAPGDAPLLPPDLAGALWAARQHAAAEVAVVHDGAGWQPLCCLVPKRLLHDLQQYLDSGGDSPRDWLGRHRVAECDYSAWPRWGWSVNTPQEWSLVETELHRWQSRRGDGIA
jgi:molybdenum cofactor guanylyltransferase